jgi:uncharacterized protein
MTTMMATVTSRIDSTPGVLPTRLPHAPVTILMSLPAPLSSMPICSSWRRVIIEDCRGDSGFVRILDAHWLAFPNYDGNGKYQSMGNLLKNPNVGMLFIDFEQQRRLRVQGVASIADEDPLVVAYAGAQFVVRVQVTEVYGNCPRYIHKYQRVQPSEYVPKAGSEPPIPAWKLRDDINPILPAHDPARKSG